VHIPLRLQIPSLIFTKALRKKDVRTSAKKVEKDSDDEASPKPETEEEEEDEMKKTRQAVINLVGVDAQRVANYLGIGGWIFGAFVKLAISVYFLFKIVGWIPLLVGILMLSLTMPANIYFTKIYLRAQDNLMKARDKKLEVVSEALGGIRQIKFSALEEKWEKKIMDSRMAELNVLWTAFRADIALVGVWLSAPVLINGGCLITYAFIQGGLTPAIAFTSISLLNKLGNTLAMLPEISTLAVDCWISAKRIGKYLNAPDKEVIATYGTTVSFENATLCWPTDDVEEDMFKLHDLNMDFPLGELSVISGRTGSGKSLLLAAILGEIELLKGKITIPRAPTHEERNDKAAHKGNWILPNAVAYVPQIPWIENCSFRDNILFGLPYIQERYDQVIQACALEKDLEILIDGDATEIGPKGINLSGGQCWRLTLARALYSRAGILLMDDIFSAVDAHVARHIYENGLTGPISEGRTRILVTHHMALCRPKTSYEVRLENGTTSYAGPVDELAKTEQLVPVDDNDEVLEIDDDVDTALDEVERTMSSTIARKLSRSSTNRDRRTSRRDSKRPVEGNGTAAPAKTPKKFVEEEDRESGHVSFAVYAHYLKACGGFWFWTIIITLFVIYQYLGIHRVGCLFMLSHTDLLRPGFCDYGRGKKSFIPPSAPPG
jgi:ABC-type multidrug transport system fused ATPase/permease subunit